MTSVVVAAALARAQGRGGHVWFVLQYLLGFRRLGLRVTLVDRVDSPATDVSGVVKLLARHDDEIDVAVLGPDGDSLCGLDRAQLSERLRRSSVLLNVMGYLDDAQLLGEARRRVFLDVDPGYPQIWREHGLADVLAGHDAYVTVGLNVGDGACTLPTCGFNWITTVQPVVLDLWPRQAGGEGWTTVATWRGPYGVVEHAGRSYGSKVHEFRKVSELPRHVQAQLGIALDIDPGEPDDLTRLRDAGWELLDPGREVGDESRYRSFVQRSRAEFSVAKPLYVETHSGWFSDRSACYLASGKPAVVQDTGVGDRLPIGDGLLTFTTPEEAAAAIDAVEREYERHSDAARAIAEEHFDSDRVLGRLLEEVAP
jgi:glycosyltransferase involved in cell wall biosynthesis